MSYPTSKVVAHSKSSVTGKEVITFELEFWRGVLAEFNTHNALSKNTSSSRAIPVPTMIKQVRENTGMPVRFGAANKGMQDAGEHNDLVTCTNEMAESLGGMYPKDAWVFAANQAADLAQAFHDAGYAKQICNRLIEPFQNVKMVVTATDLDNFYWLRDHYMADPTIEALAKAMKESRVESVPVVLEPDEWHTPYYQDGFWKWGDLNPWAEDEVTKVDNYGVTLEDALAISASCCAQASFRTLNDTIEKAKDIVSKLNLGVDMTEPCHASPTEHQATPIAASEERDCNDYGDGERYYFGKDVNQPSNSKSWQEGITHVMRDGTFGSGNLKGFIQHRQLIPGNVYIKESV